MTDITTNETSVTLMDLIGNFYVDFKRTYDIPLVKEKYLEQFERHGPIVEKSLEDKLHHENNPGIDEESGLNWFFTQVKKIFDDDSLTYTYFESIFHQDVEGDFYFFSENYVGIDLDILFKSVETVRDNQKSQFKKDYSTKDGWYNDSKFPGKLIFPNFYHGDKSPYVGMETVLLTKPDHPHQSLKEIKGIIKKVNHNAIFQLESIDGEILELNTNYIQEIRFKSLSETYEELSSKLKKADYIQYTGDGKIYSGSLLKLVVGNKHTHKFDVKDYVTTQNYNSACGYSALVPVIDQNGSEDTLNMNTLNKNRIFIKLKDGQKTYKTVKSELKNNQFEKYSHNNLISKGSKLAIIVGDEGAPSFHVEHYTIKQDWQPSNNTSAVFDVIDENNNEDTININFLDLDNFYTKSN